MTAKKSAASSDSKPTKSKVNRAKPTTERGYLARIHGRVRKQKGGNQ